MRGLKKGQVRRVQMSPELNAEINALLKNGTLERSGCLADSWPATLGVLLAAGARSIKFNYSAMGGGR